CDDDYFFVVAASGKVLVPAKVSCAMGTIAMPPATRAHGAFIQHAASTCSVGDLYRPTVGRAAPRLEAASRAHWVEHRAPLHALPFWPSNRCRCVRDLSAQKTVHIGRSPDSTAGRPLRALDTDLRFAFGALDGRLLPV